MQWGSLYIVCLALCCLQTTSAPTYHRRNCGLNQYTAELNRIMLNTLEPLRFTEDQTNGNRSRRSNEKDGLALSREIFRNITKQLRENIKRDGPTDRSDHLLHSKLEESRHYGSYQGYHHHEHHWGPYFEGEIGDPESAMQVTAHVGAEALLNCRVGMLKDKTVMWLRRTTDSAQLLTVGRSPYAGDNRIAVKFQYPNNWRLSMNPVKRSDAGLYMCQISTHPPKAILANLTVLPPVLTINGDQTHELKDRFYKAGSSIKLSCVISDDYIASLTTKVPLTTPEPTTTTPLTTTTELTTKTSTVFNRIDLMINKSWSVETTTITSTVSVSTTTKNLPEYKTTTPPIITSTVPMVLNNVYGMVWKKQGKEFNENVSWRNMSATISVATASQNDSGTYTCHLQNHSQVIINVHVLIGENQAAVHHDTWNKGTLYWQSISLIYISIIILFAT